MGAMQQATAAFATSSPAASYSNPGGTGDRRSIITVTEFSSNGGHITSGTVDPSNWIDGSLTGQNTYWINGHNLATETAWVKFDFGASYSPVIDEITYYQSSSSAVGTWQFQGSADDSSWTDIGSPFALSGIATQVITAMSGNVTGYRYYRILGVSGTTSNSPWVYEFEFKLY